MRILVLDDDALVAKSLATALLRQGYTVDLAHTAAEAVDHVKQHLYDLVLCDIRLPQGDGLDALGVLRSLQTGLRAIMITGYASEDAPVRAIKHGVDDYIMKPCSLEQLLQSVRHSLKLRQLEVDASRLAEGQRQRYLRLIVELVSAFGPDEQPMFAHAARVAALCADLGSLQQLTPSAMEHLELAAWLHDLADPVAHARSQGWSEETVTRLQAHPVVASRLLTKVADLEPVRSILSGDGPEARLLRVAEAFDRFGAQITERSELGLDPELVGLCLTLTPDTPDSADLVQREARRQRLQRLLELAAVLRDSGEPGPAAEALAAARGLAENAYRALLDSEAALLELPRDATAALALADAAAARLAAGGAAQPGRVGRNLAVALLLLDQPLRALALARACVEHHSRRGEALATAEARTLALRASARTSDFAATLDDWLRHLPPGYLAGMLPAQREGLLTLLKSAPRTAELSTALEQMKEAPAASQVQVHCLGKLRVKVGERGVSEWRSRKAQELFAFLAWARQPVGAERLAEALWPDVGGRETLHTTVYRARRALRAAGFPGELIRNERNFYFLDPDTPVWLDAAEFERLCAASQPVTAATLLGAEQARGLYRGDLLDGMYEEWVLELRSALQLKWFRLLESLAAFYAGSGGLEAALDCYSAMLERDPQREETYLALIRLLLQSGQRETAVRRFSDYATMMQGLGLPPDAALAAQLKQLQS